MAKFDHVKNQLYKFRTDNANLSKDQVAKHFIMLGYAKASVYRWLQQIENGDLYNRKKSTGRPVKFAMKTNIKKMQVFLIIKLAVLSALLPESLDATIVMFLR